MRKGMLGSIVLTAYAIGFAIGARLDAQGPRSYTWYAQVEAVDQATQTLTVKARTRDAVGQYVGNYKPGDKLLLVWVPVKGESDTIIYAPRYEVMKGIDEGYILPVEFVSADSTNHTITVKTTVPDNVLQTVKSVRPGQWIKVTTPMQQPKETAALSAAAPAEKPDLKPPPPPPMPPDESGRGRGRGAENAEAGGSALSGTWTVAATVGGNPVNIECTFKQDGSKLTGTCTGQRGSSEVTGEVTGNKITFQHKLTANGTEYELNYGGTLEPAGNALKGTLTVAGMTTEFSATKK